MTNHRRRGAAKFHSLLISCAFEDESQRNINKLKAFLERDSSYVNVKDKHYYYTPLSFVLSRLSDNFSIDVVRLLLNYGACINCINNLGEKTPLLVAIYHKTDDATIRLLLEKGADVKAQDCNGLTSLCYALRKGASIDVVKLLLDGGCHPNACRFHISPLHCASDYIPESSVLKEGVLDLLIEAGADVLQLGRDGQAPLCSALKAGAGFSDVQRLLGLGAPFACQDHASPLLCATDFKLFVDEMWKYEKDVWGMPLKAGVVELLLKADAPVDSVNEENGYTALQLALNCSIYETRALELLLDQPGVDFSVKDENNRNLLHLAAANFHCKKSAVKFLIERGVKVDELNEMGQTPLRVAVEKCTLSVASLLLKYGSPVNTGDIEGSTPLSTAVRFERGFDIIQMLLFAGARIGITNDTDDDSLLLIALDHFLSDDRQETLEILKLLWKYCVLENPEFKMKRLMWRQRKVNREIVKEMTRFENKCAKELKILKSNIGVDRLLSFQTQIAAKNPTLSNNQFDNLIHLMVGNDLSEYFELISNTVGKSTMKTKLQELQVYAIKNTNEKIDLIYDCVCEITPFLSVADLLRLIVAFAQENHKHGARDERRDKRSPEEPLENFKSTLN